jgi:hypothetical protein
MNSPALKVLQWLGRDPNAGEIHCFGGRHGDLIRIVLHDPVRAALDSADIESSAFRSDRKAFVASCVQGSATSGGNASATPEGGACA